MANMHTLNLTKAARHLAIGVINIPEQFKTLTDLGTALATATVLDMGSDTPPSEPPAFQEWVKELAPVELTEAQRDILKASCSAFPHKLPVNTHTHLLLTELGLI